MTDGRDKTSRPGESVARPTARDVPFVRGDSQSEPAPVGQRPAQLPRDPSYEAELAQVGLAVLRDPERRTDPSTKQGGRRGHELLPGQPPESITPESPGTRAAERVAVGQSPEPPSSTTRAVASGTLLSVGAVDPRGKTERTLETPRMFFSQAGGNEVYFKPAQAPTVTVHQTLETETVKLSDSIDPRRAKTMPRIDRVALGQLGDADVAESAAPMALRGSEETASEAAQRWQQAEAEAAPLPSHLDGQIHASLSAFREQAEASFGFDGVPTRAEPLAGRRASDMPDSALPSLPEASAIPTQRDLPAHRIEASRPPPAAVAPRAASSPESEGPYSEGPRPTTASIASEEPERRPAWINYAAFAAALLLAVAVGLYLTRAPEQRPAAPDGVRVPPPVEAAPQRPVTPALPAPAPVAPPAETAERPATPRLAETPAAPAPAPPAAASPKKSPLAPAADAPRKSTPSSRETIF